MEDREMKFQGNNYLADLIGINSLKHVIEYNGARFLINRIKNKLGMEYNFGQITRDSNENTFNWIDHYFPGHTRTIHQRTKFTSFFDVKKVDKRTFIFINTTGIRIGSYEKLFSEDDGAVNIYIYIFGKKAMRYWKQLDACIEKDSGPKGERLVYNIKKCINGDWNITNDNLKKRDMSQLFYAHGEKKAVEDHIDKFLSTYKLYSEKGIPYKTGILLYGRPGTGKTSMANAICTKYGRSLVSINVNNLQDIDLPWLSNILTDDDKEEFVVIFEDMDTLFINRSEKESNLNIDHNAIIQNLLQFLDGVSSPNNVIFIGTTNYIDRIDPAILREGRFDLKVEVKGLDKAGAVDMLKSFDLKEHEIMGILKKYDDERKEDDEPGIYNQAKLQSQLLSIAGIKNYDTENGGILAKPTENREDVDDDDEDEDDE